MELERLELTVSERLIHVFAPCKWIIHYGSASVARMLGNDAIIENCIRKINECLHEIRLMRLCGIL